MAIAKKTKLFVVCKLDLKSNLISSGTNKKANRALIGWTTNCC